MRENTEGEYTGVGGRMSRGLGGGLGIEVAVHSRTAIERTARYAFDLARRRRGRIALGDILSDLAALTNLDDPAGGASPTEHLASFPTSRR